MLTLLPNHWYALQVKSGFEEAVASALRFKGYDEFLPLSSSDARARSQTPRPLFPGYLFCRCPHTSASLVVTTPGVLRIVSFGRTPAVVHHEEIESIRKIVSSALARPCSYICSGQKVRITSGPLAGIEGFVLYQQNKWQVAVSVNLLKRSVAVFVSVATLDVIGNVDEHAMTVGHYAA